MCIVCIDNFVLDLWNQKCVIDFFVRKVRTNHDQLQYSIVRYKLGLGLELGYALLMFGKG